MKTQWFLYCPDPEDTGGSNTTAEANTIAGSETSSGSAAPDSENGAYGNGNSNTTGEPAYGNPAPEIQPAENTANPAVTEESAGQPAEEKAGEATAYPPDNSSEVVSQPEGSGATVQNSENAGAANYEESGVTAPDKVYIEKVLLGSVAVAKGAEVAAILGSAEFALECIEPIGGVLEIAEMIHGVWEALELPDRTCGYQGLVYGLLYGVLNMGDPKPNPTWPDMEKAPEHDETFFEGVRLAKQRLSEGPAGVKRRNLILLDIGKRGEKAVINNLWQATISEKDHLLKSFTIQWPEVGPNG